MAMARTSATLSVVGAVVIQQLLGVAVLTIVVRPPTPA